MKPEIERQIKRNGGVYSMPKKDGGIIAQCASLSQGDYLEIGTLFGGSAIMAALFLPSPGRVFCVDPFGWAEGQTRTKRTPSAELVAENAYAFGTMKKMRIFTQKHPPLPLALEDHTFAMALIDGDHSYEGVLADWENLKDRVTQYMLFHDVNTGEFGARKVFKQAQTDPDWKKIYQAGKMGVLKRRV